MSEGEVQAPIERYLAAIEGAAMASCDALSADVVVDATVPNWRFTLDGEAAARDEFGRWYSHPGCFEELTRTPLPDGELIEFTLSWEEEGVPHSVHQAHVVEVRDGRIVSDRVWCGGRWPAGLLAEMAEAARADA
jgi:ketosteroid isomerase-like protein